MYVLSLELNSKGAMDGESGDYMEEEEETDIGRVESEEEILVQGCQREIGN